MPTNPALALSKPKKTLYSDIETIDTFVNEPLITETEPLGEGALLFTL